MNNVLEAAAELRAEAARYRRLARRYEQASRVLEEAPKREPARSALRAYNIIRKSGMTYRQVGERIGFSGKSVQKVVLGAKTSRPILVALSDLFGVSLEELQTPTQR